MHPVLPSPRRGRAALGLAAASPVRSAEADLFPIVETAEGKREYAAAQAAFAERGADSPSRSATSRACLRCAE